MPGGTEFQRRAKYLERVVKAGLSPLWFFVAAVVAAVGGSALLGVLWGVRHLLWGLVIFLAIAIFVVTEGSYRAARHRETEHAGQVAKLEQARDEARAELEDVRRDLEDAQRAVATGPGEPESPPFGLHYHTLRSSVAGTPAVSHFIGIKNPAGQPERRVHVTAESMSPYPRGKSALGTGPAFPHPVPPAGADTPPPAGRAIAPGQEESWLIGRTWTHPDGKARVYEFFSDTGADWGLDPDERWRISYRITCDGVPEMPFSIVIAAEGRQAVVRLEG